jgi:ribokinase
MSRRVAVVGDVASDVVVQLHGDPAPGSDVDATIRLLGGGAGGNVASWLAAAGADVLLVGRSGADPAGEQRIAELRAQGVDVHVAGDRVLPTGTIVAVVTPDGERTLYSDRGANLALSPEDVPVTVLDACAHLHLSGYALLHPGPRPAALHALDRARAGALTTSVDASSAAPLAAVGAAEFLRWTAGIDICRANQLEAQVLTGAADAATACRRLAASHRVAVVTDGEAGAYACAAGALVHVPAVATEVVDTVGAGDAFTAGLLHGMVSHGGWLRGEDPDHRLLERACTVGARLAAEAVSIRGGRPPVVLP